MTGTLILPSPSPRINYPSLLNAVFNHYLGITSSSFRVKSEKVGETIFYPKRNVFFT